MVKKFCFSCRNFSYSAAYRGRWICPYCGYDLSKRKALSLKSYETGRVSLGAKLTLFSNKS